LIQDKKILAVIPARGGSKGIPNKNIVPLLGKPLINWTIEAARSSQYIDQLIVSSDDPQICEVAAAAGCEVPFLRPAALATDDAQTIDVVIHSMDETPGFDLVIVLQPTSPIRTSLDIDKCLELMVECGAWTAVSVTPVREHPFLVYSMSPEARLNSLVKIEPNISLRRQDLPPAYSLNGAIYIAETQWLRKSRVFVSPETVGYVMPYEASVDIDNKSDLHLAADYLRSRGNRNG
jgi:CMP-N,N'-diacetyllegionaminic acid synthase